MELYVVFLSITNTTKNIMSLFLASITRGVFMISGVEKTKQLVSSYHDYIITVILKNSVTCEWSNFHKSNFYFIHSLFMSCRHTGIMSGVSQVKDGAFSQKISNLACERLSARMFSELLTYFTNTR